MIMIMLLAQQQAGYYFWKVKDLTKVIPFIFGQRRGGDKEKRGFAPLRYPGRVGISEEGG